MSTESLHSGLVGVGAGTLVVFAGAILLGHVGVRCHGGGEGVVKVLFYGSLHVCAAGGACAAWCYHDGLGSSVGNRGP